MQPHASYYEEHETEMNFPVWTNHALVLSLLTEGSGSRSQDFNTFATKPLMLSDHVCDRNHSQPSHERCCNRSATALAELLPDLWSSFPSKHNL